MAERALALLLRGLKVGSASEVEIGHQPVVGALRDPTLAAEFSRQEPDRPRYYARSNSAELDISLHEYVELEHAGALEE